MNCNRTTRRLAGWVGALAWLAGAPAAEAVGTAADTDIGNRATVTFDVLGSSQTVESSEAGNSNPGVGNGQDTVFKVDQMIDVVVAEASGGPTMVLSPSNTQAIGFTLTNTGNAVQDFALTTAESVADAFDGTPATPEYYLDDGDGVFNSGVDTALPEDTPGNYYVDELAADPGDSSQTILIWVVRDIPAGRLDTETSDVILTATARVGGGLGSLGGTLTADAGVWQQNTLQIVFADGAGDTDAANDAAHSATDGYIVETAQMTVTKTSVVVSDPTGLSNPKAIPGAVIEYTITLLNGGSGTATNISVSDDLNTEIGNGTIAFNADAYGVGQGIQLNVNGGGAVALTNAADSPTDEGQFVGNVVTVNGLTLANGENTVIQFQVVIQ